MAQSSLFRSETMSLVQLYIPLEIAQQTTAELGEVGLIQFLDLNGQVNAFQRAFVSEIRRLDEMERKLRFLQIQLEKSEIKVKPLLGIQQYGLTRTQQEIDELERTLQDINTRMTQLNDSQSTLNKRYLELTELRHVLRESAVFFEEAESKTDDIIGNTTKEDYHLLASGDMDVDAAERGGDKSSMSIGFIAGVVPRGRLEIFERILWRLSRGNCYMNFAEIDENIIDPQTDETLKKNVFIIFAHGKQLVAKLRKAAESLGATIYPVDERPDKRREDALEVISRLEDLKHVLDNTRNTRRAELVKVSEYFLAWSTVLKKEKAIYHEINLFNYDSTRKALIAEGWVPTNSIGTIQYALRSVTERTGSTIPPLLSELPTRKTPPTFHRTNKFTRGFQNIVNAYGIASYQEVNPGLFTCITFPFLFAVMFGDLGHGLLVSLFAGWMCWKEKALAQNSGEMWKMIFGGRYIILLMGLFSIYTGIIYNDLFSKAMDLFGSGYHFSLDASLNKYVGEKKWTYAVGIDPAWHSSENSLLFLNSYKMKMAIIFGVMQMTFGISMNYFNNRHFKTPIYIIFETVPQLIFLLALFGYLVILVIYKWSSVWPGGKAPGLLNTLIYMFLSPGSIAEGQQLYPGQAFIQTMLVLIAVVCVPWMLIAKPYYLYQKHKKHSSEAHLREGLVEPSEDQVDGDGHGGDGHFEFSEIMIHQMIHTIEFCLGAISNTASYLRLWALSLAHAQLSVVLWDMVLAGMFQMQGPLQPIALVIAFSFWLVLTVAILIVMEGLSAFLHALRLHWVEFQNKFYQGVGYEFLPFSFAKLMEGDEE